MKYCTRIVANLKRKIHAKQSVPSNVFEEIEMGILSSKETLNKLRTRILKKGFPSPEDESRFFKTIKPIPLGYLIYYLSLAEFETKRPQNSSKMVKKHIQEHLSLYQKYYIEHRFFYQYLARNRTDRDSIYFIRFQSPVKFHPDALAYCIDEEFSTSHDYIAAKIFAHKLLVNRLTKELIALKTPKKPSAQPFPVQLQWTGNKVDLIELIYALHASGAINNGQTDIKELATNFQGLLNIDLGEYYRTFIEIRSRKINKTKFLERMITNLKLKMTEADI